MLTAVVLQLSRGQHSPGGPSGDGGKPRSQGSWEGRGLEWD